MFNQHKLLRFLLLITSLYAVWFITYEFVLKPNGILDKHLTNWTCYGVTFCLNLFGYDSYYILSKKLGNAYLFIQPSSAPIVRVGASCNGQELFALFFFFIMAYPGKWKLKIPFMTVGFILVYLANIFRTYCLVVLAYHKSPLYDLFHRYIFIFFIYGLVFLMWMLWANKYSKIK